MAIKLKTDYRKTLGLPGYSSHSFSAAVEVEINNIEDVHREIQELYEALQTNVDLQIQATGYVPPSTYGMKDAPKPQPNGKARPRNVTSLPVKSGWSCSEKQQELITKLVEEKQLAKSYVEDLAKQLFSKGVKALNKLEASGLIEQLFELPSEGKKSYRKGGRRG